jgi:hypothetical protein
VTRIVLSAHLGPHDTPAITAGADEKLAALNLLDDAGTLRHGIGRVIRDLKVLGLRPSSIGLDLLNLAVLVYVADTRINRGEASQDEWTREIRLILPVSDPDRWNGCGPLLARILRFLTGDLWAVEFRIWPSSIPHPLLSLPGKLPLTNYDGVSLFSGGLDSLIGAIDSLEAGAQPLFVSHGGDGSVSGPQEQLFASFARQYSGKIAPRRLRMGMRLDTGIVLGMGSEETTRGRSFLFFALGAMVGSAFGNAFQLRVPENGFISLNVPLDGTRLGSNSTRTTHPYYVHRWNELLQVVGLPCTVHNPYWDKTKGEMITHCANHVVLEKLAAISISCAHPSYKRYAQDGKDHCGTCLPCLIRRASFASSPINDPTSYRVADLAAQPLNATTAEGIQVRAVQYALDRLDANPQLADIWIHKPGPLMDDVDKLADLAGVYRRGMAEVQNVVRHAKTVS